MATPIIMPKQGQSVESCIMLGRDWAREQIEEEVGEILQEDPHAFALKGSAMGDFTVELDSRMLHPAKRMEGRGGKM